MSATARDLVLLLQGIGEREQPADAFEPLQTRLQASLSHVPKLRSSAALEYASYEVDWTGVGTKTIQGLATARSELLLTEIVDQMAAMDDAELASLFAGMQLEPSQARALLFVTYWILNALEWESRDASIPHEFDPDRRERMLKASLGSLQSFRTTGEP